MTRQTVTSFKDMTLLVTWTNCGAWDAARLLYQGDVILLQHRTYYSNWK